MSLPTEIENALGVLVGQPLTEVGRAAATGVLGFGGPGEFRSTTGETVVRTRYAIHCQCPFRLANAHGVLIGSQDIGRQHRPARPAGTAAAPAAPDEEWADTLFEARAAAIEAKLSRDPLIVRRVSATAVGDLRVELDGSLVVEVFVAHSYRTETWRALLRPEGVHYVLEAGRLRAVGPDGSVRLLPDRPGPQTRSVPQDR